MEKTMNVAIVDTKDQVMKVLVDSQLPVMVVAMILKDVKEIVDAQAQQILQNERSTYEAAQAKANEDDF